MELSLRLDTLGMVEMRYLRIRERYRDWPAFQLLAASRQARVLSYLPRDVAEQLHLQILAVEEAIGLDIGADEDDDEEENDDSSSENGFHAEEGEAEESTPATERESNAFSPAFASALKQLNELARQRLPDPSTSPSELSDTDIEGLGNEEDALEQLQDAFVQMMEVVRELAEELSTDALKLTGRFKCARTNIEFVPRPLDDEDDDEDDEDDDEDVELELAREGIMEIELTLILQLFEEGRAKPDDVPAVELQLDVDDFERLHETLDFALDRDRSSRRRRS